MDRRIDSMSQATNWAHKHHFIVGKTKKTILVGQLKKKKRKRTSWYILRAQNVVLFATVGVNLSK